MRKKYYSVALLLSATIATLVMTGCSNTSTNTKSVQAKTEAASNTEGNSEEEPKSEVASVDTESDNKVLMIADQGIFSAGGTTITSEGEFTPEDQWEETGAGQTAHVDHANVL